MSGFKYVDSPKVLSFNSDSPSIIIPIKCNLPPSNSKESVAADSFKRALISFAPNASG